MFSSFQSFDCFTQSTPCSYNLSQNFQRQNFFPTYYDTKQVRNQLKNHHLLGLHLSYKLISAIRGALVDRFAGTRQLVAQKETYEQMFFLTDSNLFCIIVGRIIGLVFRTFGLGQKHQEHTVIIHTLILFLFSFLQILCIYQNSLESFITFYVIVQLFVVAYLGCTLEAGTSQ